jgi:hypothetical protein
MGRKKLGASIQLELILKGDRRMAEALILEVRSAAQQCGLGIPTVQVQRHPAIRPKGKSRRQV